MRIPISFGFCVAPIVRLSSSLDKSRVAARRYGSSLSSHEEARQCFLQWAQANAIPIASNSEEEEEDGEDLKVLVETIIGDAQVVAISEGFHNCREMMALHHRVIRYLIQHHGFTTVITESGLPESRIIHDYILEEEETPNPSLLYKQGLNKMYAEWKEGRDLIEWMRDYNHKHDNCLRYYGSDIGGFYQDWATPFRRIFAYLSSVDVPFHETLSADLQPYLDLMSEKARLNYQDKLSRLEKAKLEVLLDEALATMDSRRAQYLDQDKSSETEFEWARQSLESMRLAEHYYRNYEQRCQLKSSKSVGLNGREVAMHRNILWVLEKERKRLGRDAKAIVISHVIHTKTESQYQDEVWGFFTPAGQMLKQSLGDKFCVIGMAYGGGSGRGAVWRPFHRSKNRVWKRRFKRFPRSVAFCPGGMPHKVHNHGSRRFAPCAKMIILSTFDRGSGMPVSL